jgi:VWFA-related protein
MLDDGSSMLTRTCVSLAVALLALQGQQSQQPVFRGTTETVAVPVAVFDQTGELVTTLGRDDFEVRDEGRLQKITTFTHGLQPISAVALVDISASMTAALDLARFAAEQFVIRLRPEDKATVGTFAADVDIRPGLTADRDTLLGRLRRELPFSNPTRLLDAIDAAVTDLEQAGGRRVVAVFTDGCDTASEVTWDKVLQHVYRNDVLIYSIKLRGNIIPPAPPQGLVIQRGSHVDQGPCYLDARLELHSATPLSEFLKIDQPRWVRGPGLLADLVSVTGGGSVAISPQVDVNLTMSRLMDELHYQYLLGFTPEQLDGKVHELSVKVVDKTMRVRARKNYLASPKTAG